MIDSTVPICFATDDGYALPTAVAIKSLLDSFSGENVFIVILCSGSLSNKSKEIIEKSVSTKSKRIKLEYISVDNAQLRNITSHIEHITTATYFRLFLPQLLSEYRKCLYLDGDICVTGDIAPLLSIEMSSNEYVAGVKAFGAITSKLKRQRLKILNIKSIDEYINAGVLLMNLEAIRSSKIDEEWMRLVKNDYPVQDQDVINVACYSRIKHIEPKYNAMPVLFQHSNKRLAKVYLKKEVIEAKKEPTIIHYADKYKPWTYCGIELERPWHETYIKLTGKEHLELKHIGLTRTVDRWKSRINYLLKKVKAQ